MTGLAVTVDLDLTGSTLTLNDTFGTSTHLKLFTIATYSGTLTGQFASVTGIPTGYELRYDSSGKRIIALSGTYELWTSEFPVLSDPYPEGDRDGGGIPNLVESVVGGDPRVGNPARYGTDYRQSAVPL